MMKPAVVIALTLVTLSPACGESSGLNHDAGQWPSPQGDAGADTGPGGGTDASPPQLPEGVTQLSSKLLRDPAPDVSSASVTQLGQDNRAFALDLYRELGAEPGNLFFSPYSISSALAMAYAGAKGQTGSQMASVLHYGLPPEELFPTFNSVDATLGKRGDNSESGDKTFQLAVTNALWAQQGFSFLPAYLDTLAVNFGTGLNVLDFFHSPDESRSTINAWVADQTHDRIPMLLGPGTITQETRLVLTNAAYFKAHWVHEFDASTTQNETFHTLDGELSVPMMHESLSTAYARGEGWQAVLLPYSAPELSMLLIVPDAGSFDAVDRNLSAATLDTILSALTSNYWVDLKLPRFQFDSKFSLANTLGTLGMANAFDDKRADFSGMDGRNDLHISDVIHQAFVTVDEKGTEAAAATAVILEGTASLVPTPPSATLHVDRPFLFAVYDQPTGELLFLGRVVEPKQ